MEQFGTINPLPGPAEPRGSSLAGKSRTAVELPALPDISAAVKHLHLQFALDEFEQAVKESEVSAATWFAFGCAQQELGDHKSAKQADCRAKELGCEGAICETAEILSKP